MKIRALVSVSALSLAWAAGVEASVAFSVTYSGFDAQQQAAFAAATAVWSDYLQESYAGDTVRISATLFSEAPNSQGLITLGSTSVSNYYLLQGGGVFTNTAYALSLADHLVGGEIEPGNPAINIRFNTYSAINWYYGTDGNAGAQRDFYTVVLHEIGHGLGITSSIGPSGVYGIGTYPAVYDQFLEYNRTKLVNMTDAQRQTAITSGALYWDGTNAVSANGGLVALYAPAPYVPGSSISHIDEATYANDLMSPMYSGVDHKPSAVDLGMLKDIGWTVVPEPGVLVLLAGSFSLTLARPRRVSRN